MENTFGRDNQLSVYKKIASFGEPVIMSTGMCDEDDIRNAMAVLTDNGLRREQITILHCNTQYPTPMADVNLRAMLTINGISE